MTRRFKFLIFTLFSFFLPYGLLAENTEYSFNEEHIKLANEVIKVLENHHFTKKKYSEVDYIFLIALMIIDDSDNVEYFLFKFNVSKVDKKRILFLKNFYDKKVNKNFFSEKNLWKILYYNGKQSLEDLLYFEIFKSKNINKKLINLIDLFKKKEVPIFPIKAKNLIEKYNIPEGKLLGIKLKKIEEKWINNDFKISAKEVAQVIEN